MRSSVTSALLLSAATGGAHAAGWQGQYKFGNMFYTGPTKNGVTITKATYSLVPPSVPCGYATTGGNEELAFWIGIQDDPTGKDVAQESFVQPLLNWAPDQRATGCETDNNQWCVAASTYTPSGQIGQPYLPIENGIQLDFELVAGSEVKQTISSGGKVISTQTNAAGMKPAVFYGANECYLQSCGTLQGYTWENITVHLSAADPNYGNTLSLTSATSDGFETADGGKTWTNAGITIQKDYLYSDDQNHECN
ncbi:hypothetical protein NCS57_00008100 [Fusarium keratoplasticum]|uniref:Uncharacterized protein n=1 Tax=Fusarium keratoplasticum TaxID=1328300 RepID=A0ACC0RB43_9HYPO|nr:hypothetical protein NCS57_00008100 [Fusarium keratoplasticum]KAI8683439.1 hypothetical protein NCS57_00008100 [Fusarium keratoplasticum]KAI8687559.1 hypothetical protein NCS55_00007600 [Fusarium keratoplasticum]